MLIGPNLALTNRTLRKGGGLTALQILQSKGSAFFLHDFVGRTDLTFQNAAGTTLADDNGEAVALALSIDQIGSKTLAATLAAQVNVISPLDFTTGWTPQGVANTSTGANTFTRSEVGGPSKLHFTVGKYYQINVDLTVTSTTLRLVNAVGSGTGAQWIFGDGLTTGVYSRIWRAVNAELYFRLAGAGTLTINSISIKEIPGNHAIQSVSTGFRPTRQADGSVKGDRLDDRLLQALTSSGSMFMGAALLGASIPPATAAIIGGPVSTTRGYLSRDTSGRLSAGVGADGPSTIFGGSDIAGLKGVAMLNIDASGNVDLEWMPKGGALASLYSAPINGAVAAGTAMQLFATNAAGTAANFGGDSLYFATAIQTTLTASERRALANDWNSRIPS